MFEQIYLFVMTTLFDVSNLTTLTEADKALISLVALALSIFITIMLLYFCYKFVKWLFYKIANGGGR